MSHPSRSLLPARSRPAAASRAVAGHQPVAIALALAACFAAAAPVRAQPSGAQAIHGSATLGQNGSRLTVSTQNGAGTNHSAINWQSFSIPAGSSAWFAQPGATSTSINRVLGSDPSAIFGTLGSNGRLVLVNPAGITVGAGAVVDTAGFTASTLRMSDADALSGRMLFGGDGKDSAGLQVGGSVVARGGDVVLIAPNVEVGESGVVQAIDGSTVLAAGRKVAMTGRGLEGIHLELTAPSDHALNLGTLKGDSVGLFAGQLRHSGLAQARFASLQGGRVVLRAEGDALVDGRLDASSAQGIGGSVDVLGARVALFGAAQLDASGAIGGGQVRIGGDYQGANAAVPNASRTFVGGDVQVNADALGSGNGGRVIVWADEATDMQGRLSARGGADGGDGGFAEVSGRQALAFTGRADLRAPRGRAGTLLLDPNDITIQIDGSTTANPPAPTPAQGDWVFSGGSDPGIVTVANLESQLGLGNVLVKTTEVPGTGSGTITVAAPVTWSSGNSLGLSAHNGIAINADITGESTVGGPPYGSLSLLTVAGNIAQGSGRIKVNQLVAKSDTGSVNLSQVNQVNSVAGSADGAFEFRNGRTLSVASITTPSAGPVAVAGVTSSTGAVFLETTAGNLNVSAGAPVTGETGVTLRTTGPDADVIANAEVKVTGPTGELYISSARNVSFGDLVTAGGPVTIEAGGFIAGYSINTSVRDPYDPNPDGRNGGDVSLTASDGSISLASIRTDGNNGLIGGNAGDVTLLAPSSDVESRSVDVYNINATGGAGAGGAAGDGGDVRVTAGRRISIDTIETYGGHSDFSEAGPGGVGGTGGAIVVRSTGGDVYGGYFESSGGDGAPGFMGGEAGDISLTSDTGSIGFDCECSGSIIANGGYGRSGGRGGTISLKAPQGGVNVDQVDAYGGGGGDSSSLGGDGGPGGNITVEARLAYLSELGVSGGDGGSNANGVGGRGGDAGDITLKLTGTAPEDVLDLTYTSIHAYGGSGGDGSTIGGAGGTGGDVSIAAANLMANSGSPGGIDAGGGGGGYGTESTSRGGTGGNGGTISFDLTGAASSWSGVIHAGGGQGGDVSSESSVLFGSGGAGGVVTLNVAASAMLDLGGIVYVMGGEAGGAVGSFNTYGPGAITVPGSLLVGGNWTSNGPLRIGEEAAASVLLGTYEGAPFGTLTNYGTLSGTGTLNGNLTNAGIVAPGNSPGILMVTGDYLQTASGTLQMEVSGNTAGTSYDQLNVGGATTLGGTLAMFLSGYTVQPTDSFDIITGPGPLSGEFVYTSVVPAALANKLFAIGAPVPIAAAPVPPPPAPVPPPPPPPPPPAPVPPPPPPPPPPAPVPPPPAPPAPPAPPPPPPPPPAPVPPPPPPSSGSTVDQIVALLRNETSRDVVLGALSEQDGLVPDFLTLLLREEARQSGRDDITITDTQCKP